MLARTRRLLVVVLAVRTAMRDGDARTETISAGGKGERVRQMEKQETSSAHGMLLLTPFSSSTSDAHFFPSPSILKIALFSPF